MRLEEGALELRRRLEGAVDGVAAPHVAELQPHLGAAASDLVVLVADDGVQLAVQLDRNASLQLSGIDHLLAPHACTARCDGIFGAELSTRQRPFSSTT